MKKLKELWEKTSWFVTVALPKAAKWTLVAYVAVSVAWFTATLDGSQHKLKFWTDNAVAKEKIQKDPGELSYEAWRAKRAAWLRKTDHWEDYAEKEAESVVDTKVQMGLQADRDYKMGRSEEPPQEIPFASQR